MLQVAKLLARALDNEDYEAALRCLAPDCQYELRGQLIIGAAEIIDSYRSNSDQGKQRFDSIKYESTTTATGPSSARIDYMDILTLDGDTHIHRCSQEVWLNPDALISRILHMDPEGEMEALQHFLELHSR